ncbi:MAG: hypothetical protein KDA78_08600, partial [Planctomycetaceae bacterium]|nr:hypothetical protein [Planctomycetaceae bacterium]
MRMASFSFLLALLFILPSASAAEPVTLQVINEKNRDQVMPQGKEVDAIDGDLVLSNGLVTAVIAQPLATRNANMTVREIGGCLIDLTQLDAQSDQLSCYYPGSRVYAFRSWSARDAAENPVVINESTQASHPQALEVVVNAAATEGRAALEVVYRLEAGASNLIIEQTYFNPNPGEVEINLSDDIRYDSGKEDARRSPNGKSPLVYVDDVYWQQCYGVASPGKELTSRSDSRYTIIRYGSGSRQPDLVLKKGEQFRNTVELFCAPNLSRLEELYSLASHGSAATSCTFHALQKDKSVLDGVPHVRIELTRDGQYAGTLWTDGSGRVDCKLLPGDYEATVSYLNLPLLEKQPLKVGNSREEFKLSLP